MNPASKDHFATTRWTMVIAAGKPGTVAAEKALGELCEAYWFPLYAYVRRRGYSKEDAEDLTQGFFARLMSGDPFADLSSGGGRFRAFLLAAMKNFIANEWHRARTLKRGGTVTHFPLDWESADSRFGIADHDGITPDLAFDREWALTLLGKVVGDLGAEFSAAGKEAEFSVLRAYLTAGKGEIPYDGMAEKLNIDSGALRVKIHRLRKRYRESLKAEIARTLADPLAVDEELRVLMGAFGKRP